LRVDVRRFVRLAPVRMLLAIREIPAGREPCHLFRDGEYSLLSCDPRWSRLEITCWNVEHLTVDEANMYRAGFGLPPLPNRAPDWITDDRPCFLYVPPALRLTGASALQGGRELARRRALGQIEMELAAYRSELNAASRGA
jgi:hypothetical protein